MGTEYGIIEYRCGDYRDLLPETLEGDEPEYFELQPDVGFCVDVDNSDIEEDTGVGADTQP